MNFRITLSSLIFLLASLISLNHRNAIDDKLKRDMLKGR
jgi:hypothetical protein